ncbi:MAG TPA: Crp/Fnr family transcriptional regulator [Burkholderiales bacterium]|nr:Crp/Fnr family transcriptional regulator [Burkholderiales bacterium]
MKLLSGLDDTVLEALAPECCWRRYVAGQRVISRDARDNDVYLIVSGRVRITAFSGGGRQVTYRDVSAADWFGDLAAIDGLSRSADVEALEDTVLAVMTPVLFKRLVHDHPVVCDRVLERLTGFVRDLSERVFDFSTLSVSARIQTEVLRLAREAGIDGNSARIDPAPKHADMASKVATYREQVTREITAMVKQGLLERSGKTLVVPDVQRLERLISEGRRDA